MFGRYSFFKSSLYQDISVQGEYSPLTNPYSLIAALPGTSFKNSDFYPDTLTYNYTDVEFKYEPNKLTIDEITLNLFYMVPYTLYVSSKKTVSSSIGAFSLGKEVAFEKEDILLDINNIPHKDLLYELDDDSVEYLITPQPSDWNSMLAYMENARKG